MNYSEDAILLLHHIDRGGLAPNSIGPTMDRFEWERDRAKAAHREIANLVGFLGSLNAAGRAVIKENPLGGEGGDGDNVTPLASRQTKRQIVSLLKEGKYALPFDQGRFAVFSVMGTNDWEDYASLVLQMIQVDTLLNIEEKLDSLLTVLDRDVADPAAGGSIDQPGLQG